MPPDERRKRPVTTRGDDREVPDWAVELMRTVGNLRGDVADVETRLGSRLSRIEGGLALAGFAIMAAIAAHAAGIW